MKEFWDERYGKKEFAYGTAPNDFFKEWLDKQKPGTILFPCEGEGRNAVYAATKGWNVFAFDYSVKGKEKADLLASSLKVSINYEVNDALYYKSEQKFDAIVFIFAHFPESIRQNIHKRLTSFLKPGGVVLLEAFNTQQIGNESGGPKNVELLYSLKILKDDFSELDIQLLENKEIQLYEGHFHEGKADVVRLIAKKKA
ncbi:MAG TPA: class I SAM-dependent methyltransferase [Bacteroidales bacterium]